MPLRRMPNGEVIDVPENIDPAALARIEAEYKPSRQQRRAEARRAAETSAVPTSEQTEVQNRVGRRRALGMTKGVSDSINQGFLFNMGDELAGGVGALMRGVPAAIREGDFSQIPREYRIGRDVERTLQTDYNNESPGWALGGEVAGAVANPIGTGAGGVRALARVAGETGLGRAASALARGMEGGPVRSAISAGATQGALNAAGSAESLEDTPRALAHGAGVGAVTGGALGGLAHAGRRGVQIIQDANEANASRTALAKIDRLLEYAKLTPRQAADEIRATDRAGGDAMLMDLSPGLRGQAMVLSRTSEVPSSNELVQRGEERIADRRARFGQQVSDSAPDLPTTDAYARRASIDAQRKAQGDKDYQEGGILDRQITWTDDMSRWFQESPDADRLIREANTIAQREGQKLVDAIPMPNGNIQAVPSMRVYDYLKRAYDGEIGQAIESGNKTLARGMSRNLEQLKGMLIEQNPWYAHVLETQRDAFRKINAVELGEQAMKRLRSDPRSLLRDLRQLDQKDVVDARIGIIDALMSMDIKADPVGFFQSVMRNQAQRKVMEFAFGDAKSLKKFEKWVTREARSREADKVTASGRQSITGHIDLVDQELGGAGNVAVAALRGAAFGGQAGFFANALAKIQELAGSNSVKVQDEIAKLLLSKGDNLEAGIAETRKYQARRERNNKRVATLVAKGGQQGFTSIVGGS